MVFGVGYLSRKYVRDFVKIAAPITIMLKGKFEKFTLTSNCHASFEALKKATTKASISRIVYPLKGGLV